MGGNWVQMRSQRWGSHDGIFFLFYIESESCSVVSDSLQPHGLYRLWNSLGQNTRVCILSHLQGIFPTHGSNPGLLHFRQILYLLSHKGSPRILKWVAYPFSSGSSGPWNQTRVSCIAGGFFTNWAIRKAPHNCTRGLVLMLSENLFLHSIFFILFSLVRKKQVIILLDIPQY